MREKSKLGNCSIHYARREDAELAVDKLAYLLEAKLDEIAFEKITPDGKNNWLNQSNSDFDKLMPLADRRTKLAKTVDDERAVFGLYSLGIVTARDEWSYDIEAEKLSEKVSFFCHKYESERRRFNLESPSPNSLSDWVDRSIKWTSELENHLGKGNSLAFNSDNMVSALFRPYISRHCYYAPIFTHRRYQHPHIFPQGRHGSNKVICFSGVASTKPFQVVATDRMFSFDMLEKNQCLPLYRYTGNGERVSNITEWGIRLINEHYRKEWGKDFDGIYRDGGITAEDIFAYTYAVLHDPVYRYDYAVDLLREFPRLPLYHDFDIWARMGQKLLDLHLGFESAEPYPLQRNDQAGAATRVILRPDKERGVIVLDDKTTLTGVPPDAWRYRLGSRSALEWVLDQYKERKPKDPTIAERFNTYRFADHKERVIDLLQRVCTVSVQTMDVVDDMAYWEGDDLIVFGDRDKHELAMQSLSEWFGRDEDEDWLAAWSET